MRLPRRLTVSDYGSYDDSRFRHEPAIWHIIGMTLWNTGLLPKPVRTWWINRFLAALGRAAAEQREAEKPIGDI